MLTIGDHCQLHVHALPFHTQPEFGELLVVTHVKRFCWLLAGKLVCTHFVGIWALDSGALTWPKLINAKVA